MAFIPRKKVDELDYKTAIIANSQTLKVGDVFYFGESSNYAAAYPAANTTGIVAGVVVSILAAPGVSKPLEVTSYAAASNNETVAQVAVEYIPAYIPIEYLADLSGVAGTTSNSDKPGYFNLSSTLSGTLDETSWGAPTTQKQFFSYGVTSFNTSQVVGKFATTKVQ